jgi:hypothetical protein
MTDVPSAELRPYRSGTLNDELALASEDRGDLQSMNHQGGLAVRKPSHEKSISIVLDASWKKQEPGRISVVPGSELKVLNCLACQHDVGVTVVLLRWCWRY